MACLNPDGTLTIVARAVLTALARPAVAAEVARRAGVPLYRARASLREMGGHRLVDAEGDGEAAVWRLTEAGTEALEIDAEPS